MTVNNVCNIESNRSKLVQGSQLYGTFPFSTASLVQHSPHQAKVKSMSLAAIAGTDKKCRKDVYLSAG
jgi:hypothetical protein